MLQAKDITHFSKTALKMMGVSRVRVPVLMATLMMMSGVPGAELVRAESTGVIVHCTAKVVLVRWCGLGLRGGGLAEEQVAREARMAANVDKLRAITQELQEVVDDGEDKVADTCCVALHSNGLVPVMTWARSRHAAKVSV